MANNTPPRWGFLIDKSHMICVRTDSNWVMYVRADALMGGWQWERYQSSNEPMFLAPEGAPLPDAETWPETHAKLIAAINDAIASVVAKEVNR